MIKHLFIFLLLLYVATISAMNEQDRLRFNQFTVDEGLSQNTVMAIARDKYGLMWFGTWEGVCRFDGYHFRIFRANAGNPGSITNNRINAIIRDAVGDIWLGTGDQRYFFRFNYKTEDFSRYRQTDVPDSLRQLLSSYINSRKQAANGVNVWRSSPDGLLQKNIKTGQEYWYKTDRNTPFSLSDDIINALLVDGNLLWVGTHNGGVNVADLSAGLFNYYHVPGTAEYDFVIRAVSQDATDRLWVGTENKGVYVFDKQRKLIAQLDARKLISQEIRSVCCDSKGNVWIGTKGGLDKLDPGSGKIRHYYASEPGSIAHPWVFSVTEDSRGNVWTGTFGGLAFYDYQQDKFFSFPTGKILNSSNVRTILEDKKGRLWVGTEGGGLTCLTVRYENNRPVSVLPKHFRHSEKTPESLVSDMVLALEEDVAGNIWIGTNNGLCVLNPQTGLMDRYTVEQGFPDDLIMGILSDGKDHVWVSHKKGITCMHIRSREMRTYNHFDGLQGNEFTQNACYINEKSGEMFFGGTNGLNSFFPARLYQQQTKPRVMITGLKIMNQWVYPGMKINNRVVMKQSVLCSDKIQLSWEDRNFSIHFSALNFINPAGSKYRFRLEGIDDTWNIAADGKQEATYTHLPAGNYRFVVHAAGNNGEWSEQPAMLAVEILPPWWQSWWAKLFYLTLAFAAVWFVFRYVYAKIEYRNNLMLERLKNEKNEELMQLKLQFFTEISHEFRTPLTLIIDPLEQLIKGIPDEEQKQVYFRLMHKNAQQLLNLINQLLDFRKLQSGNLQFSPEPGELIQFVGNTLSVFRPKADDQQIHFRITSSQDVVYTAFDQDKVQKILLNLVSNAFRFTPRAGKITVDISIGDENPDYICIRVQDNGKGIPEEQTDRIFDAFYQAGNQQAGEAHSGLGLALAKELTLLMGGNISVTSKPANGSCFTVLIPYLKVDEASVIAAQPVGDNMPVHVPEPENQSEDDELPLLLVVDDNEDIRNYISINFRNTYRIIVAADGLAGFNLAVEHIPDIIICDIMMPGVDGIEFCHRIKKDAFTSHIPVVLLTARQTDDSRIQGYETGADDYITKPFNKQLLEVRLHNLLEQRARLREHYNAVKSGEEGKVMVNISDDAFLAEIQQLLLARLEDTTFGPEDLATALKMSRSQLYRKVRAITNRTVHDLILSVRMNKARELLLRDKLSVSETAYKVGFTLPTNFTRTFTKYFGQKPSDYIRNHQQ